MPVLVQGMAELQRDLAKLPKRADKSLQQGLREVAQPVADDAYFLSLAKIRRMPWSPQWAKNRVGVTRHSVYIAPVKRGVKGNPFDPKRRPNLVELIMGRSYEPAAERGAVEVEAAVSRLLGRDLF